MGQGFRWLAAPTKSKRDKRGFHRFDYYGVSPREFMGAMRTKKYAGGKVSRKGSSIGEMMQSYTKGKWHRPLVTYSVATKIPKKKRRVI